MKKKSEQSKNPSPSVIQTSYEIGKVYGGETREKQVNKKEVSLLFVVSSLNHGLIRLNDYTD